MSCNTVARNAVGRIAQLGDLYDARTDTFIGFSMINGPIPENAITITKVAKSTVGFINAENISEKFEKLCVEQELRASILANLVQLEGHGKYLQVESKNDKARKSMIYTIQTEDENLILSKLLLATDAFDLDFATHFVIGITWGAKTVVTLEEERNIKENEREKGDSDLNKEIRSLGRSIYEAQNSNSNNSSNNYSIEMFGDILPASNLPKNVEDTEKLLKKIPRLVQMANQGKGKQISYNLMSISDLDEYLNVVIPKQVISPLDQNAIIKMTDFVDEIMELKKQINDVMFKFENHVNCVPEEYNHKLSRIKSELETAEIKLRNKFKENIIAIRSGKLANEVLNYEFSLDEVRIRLIDFDYMLKKIDLHDRYKAWGADYVGSDSPLKLDDIKRLATKVYVLYLRAAVAQIDEDVWNRNKLYFTHLLDRFVVSAYYSFVVVDLDVRPDLAICETEGAQIGLIENGELVDTDVYATYMRHKHSCFAKTQTARESCQKPSRRIELELRCPGSFKKMCVDTKHKWHCFDCKQPLFFGFDDFFYCSCGKAVSEDFSFKCNDSKHESFIPFEKVQLKTLISQIPKLDELNVLILGATGVGKSTWINAFINYLSFNTLDEASKNELFAVTSTAFQLTDGANNTHTIRFGKDENEVLEPGQSATQDVKAHLFPIGKTLLRLIDTPGIGDVRGVERDKENLGKILSYLSTLQHLNGICILLKPNESRLNVLFEFCVKELLTHLHKSACKNVVFCFTHSRETFYKPGDTRQPLGKLLSANQIDLKLNIDTMYCMDNESFRFLCATNQGIEFPDSVMKSFSESWNISVEESNRLIEHFKTVQPHVIDDTISLNDARKNIVCLTKPIADISQNIQQNLAIIKDKKDLLTSSKLSATELTKELYLDLIKLESLPLNHPRTVCGANSCIKYYPTADGTKQAIEYVKHCHPHCYIKSVPVEIVGDSGLTQCAAMNGTSNCIVCGCSWDQHLHITYEQIRVMDRVTVPEVNLKLMGKKTEQQLLVAFIQSLEEMRVKEEEEQRKIIGISVKFGRYLSKNAILPYNDVLGKYVDHLIEKEEHKVGGGGNADLLKRLKEMRKMYDEEVKALTAAMAHPNAEELTFDEFRGQLNELYSLELNGEQLRNAIEAASTSSYDANNKESEKFYAPKNQFRGFRLRHGDRFQAGAQNDYAGITKTIQKSWRKLTNRFFRQKV